MTRFTLQVLIPRDRPSVFAALTDPGRRILRWFYGTAEITDLSGPLSVAGTTFLQRVIKGIERPGAVIAADPPRLWHVRLAGFGERRTSSSNSTRPTTGLGCGWRRTSETGLPPWGRWSTA